MQRPCRPISLRHFVDATSGDLLCADTWESVGPGRGVYGRTQGGFVDTNYFLIDKLTCNDVFPEWAMTRFAGGTGGVVVDNIELEPGVRTGGGSVVTRHAGAGTHLQGVPAHPVTTMRRFGPTPRD